MLPVAVVVVREPAFRASLARVLWFDRFDRNATFRRFVLHVFDESTKGPYVMPLGERQAVADAL
jgi:hypothetical protein